MFERYTERARRVIFFACQEANRFGSKAIETEHFLLGLLREDGNLTSRFLSFFSSAESLRVDIEGRIIFREKAATSIDLPLSNECKRILAYSAEEAERLNQRHIGTEHLLLGILREQNCVAAQVLDQRGLKLEALREELARDPKVFRRPDQLAREGVVRPGILQHDLLLQGRLQRPGRVPAGRDRFGAGDEDDLGTWAQ